MSFISSSKRLLQIEHELNLPPVEPVNYGIAFLDKLTDGIYPEDLIVVTAKTGGGKTEFLANLLFTAAKAKKKVHMFALEAYQNEIEHRIIFKSLVNAFYLCVPRHERKEIPNYQTWLRRKQDHLLKKYEPEVLQELEKYFETQFTYYTESEFTTKTLEDQLYLIERDTDLVILDHLHFMDLDDDHEHRGLKKAVKEIKKLKNFFKKPIIMAAQLRKGEKFSGQLLPSLDDIFGSSEVVKMATWVLALAPGPLSTSQATIRNTYIRALKSRTDGTRTMFTAQVGYDFAKNAYADDFVLGILKKDDTEFEPITNMEIYPQWAKFINRR